MYVHYVGESANTSEKVTFSCLNIFYNPLDAKALCAKDASCVGFSFEECKAEHCKEDEKLYMWFKKSHKGGLFPLQV